MKQALVDLLKIKSIITLVIVGAMSYMALKGMIDPATYTTLAGSVVTYYFTKKENKED